MKPTTIRYGATVRLTHKNTGKYLNGQDIEYIHPGSSHQKMITCSSGKARTGKWLVNPADGIGLDFSAGYEVRPGATIRLENVVFGYNLHSHRDCTSPTSSQQEVTGYGNEGEGDPNDNWAVRTQDGKSWVEGDPFKLIHISTGVALHSHGGNSDPKLTHGEQEVTGFKGDNDDDLWVVEFCSNPYWINASAAPGQRWIQLLSISSSIASITGVTFLAVAAAFRGTHLVDGVTYCFAAASCVAVLLALLLISGYGFTIIRLRTKDRLSHILYWLCFLLIAFLVIVYSCKGIILFSQNGLRNSLVTPLGGQ